MPITKDQLFEKFDELEIKTTTVEHQALHSVEESQALRGQIPGGHTKNLFLKCKKGSLWLIVALETTKVDLKMLFKTLQTGRFSFGSSDLLYETLGVYPGSVTPFALINDKSGDVQVVLDLNMMKFDVLNFHPLENTFTTSIKRDDLVKFLEEIEHSPKILEL